MSAEVWIGPDSPLLAFGPGRAASGGNGWSMSQTGSMVCAGSQICSIELDSVIYSEILFLYQPSSGAAFSIKAGLDGVIQAQDIGSICRLSASLGNHTARLETSCLSCTGDQAFELLGVKLVTEVIPSGNPVNKTVDDTSPAITYTAFTSVGRSEGSTSTGPGFHAIPNAPPAPSTQNAYNQTLSYTSTEGATAIVALSSDVSALYIFGCTGPASGQYSVALDDGLKRTFNASNSYETYNTLLYLVTGLPAAEAPHHIVVTNEVDGGLLAIDYVVAVTSVEASTNTVGGGTAAFPSATSTAYPSSIQTKSSTGAIIGGVLGGLLGLALLALAYRYWAYRKAGGKGNLGTILCGPAGRAKPEAKKAKGSSFALWPMIRSRPKYDTN